MIKIFLDACVLVPISLTNVIRTAAEHDLVQPYWPSTVVEEAVLAIAEMRPGLGEDRIRRRFTAMNSAFPGASVTAGTSTLDDYYFPDPDDKHVAAAAMAAGAQTVVTANTKDFPKPLIHRLGLSVMTPDDLLLALLEDDTEAMTSVVVEITEALNNPARTKDDILVSLRLAGAPRFATKVRGLLKLDGLLLDTDERFVVRNTHHG